jgi:hypothetical protein
MQTAVGVGPARCKYASEVASLLLTWHASPDQGVNHSPPNSEPDLGS